MKLLSWNVNGIRAVSRKYFFPWFEEQGADIVCLQEVKATREQLEENLIHPGGYHSYWHPAEKLGYSGVAVYSKKEPISVKYGIGVPEIDREGRVLILEYSKFTLINTYFPNSQRDHARLDYKLNFCDHIHRVCDEYKKTGKNILMCGDFNIAHREIDLRNPKSNEKNAGFLPEERNWLDRFLRDGYVDGFRHFTPDPNHYTWWSYRPGVREKNIGWRLDYFVSNQEFGDRLKEVSHQNQVLGSDHCPVVCTLKT